MADNIANIIMIAIGMIISAGGAFLTFTAIMKNLFLKNASGKARVRCLVIGIFLLAVGFFWLWLCFSGE